MQYTTLGINGPRVSRIAFGCMSTVANATYHGIADAEGIATIRSALDHGINFFDTAPAYGDGASEDLLGRALEGVRDQAVVADKISTPTLSAAVVKSECEKSLRRLRTSVIDLYQIHWPSRTEPLEETLRAMEDLVTAGKVKMLGVCNFGRHDLTEAFGVGVPLVSNQITYSLLTRAVELEVRELCLSRGVGLLCYSPLAQGLLAGRYRTADDVPAERARTRMFSRDRPHSRHDEAGAETEAFAAIAAIRAVAERRGATMANVSLAWVLQQPGVLSVLVGASRADQVARNATAVDLKLSDAELTELNRATAATRSAMGSSLDLWATPSRTR